MQEDPELQVIDRIYDALDAGDPEGALHLARQTARDDTGEDPVLRFLAGVALLELDDAPAATEELRRAVSLDADDPEFRTNLALALFRSCRFDEALAEARRAVDAAPRFADAHYVLALALERDPGSREEAERHFARAARLEPEVYVTPPRLERADFEASVLRAEIILPEEFRRHLEAVAVTVEELPADEILSGGGGRPLDPELLGLFVGVPLSERSTLSPGGELPARILLFQRNLERTFPGRGDLETEIARTLHHELGHYLGLDEDELAAIDLA